MPYQDKSIDEIGAILASEPLIIEQLATLIHAYESLLKEYSKQIENQSDLLLKMRDALIEQKAETVVLKLQSQPNKPFKRKRGRRRKVFSLADMYAEFHALPRSKPQSKPKSEHKKRGPKPKYEELYGEWAAIQIDKLKAEKPMTTRRALAIVMNRDGLSGSKFYDQMYPRERKLFHRLEKALSRARKKVQLK